MRLLGKFAILALTGFVVVPISSERPAHAQDDCDCKAPVEQRLGGFTQSHVEGNQQETVYPAAGSDRSRHPSRGK